MVWFRLKKTRQVGGPWGVRLSSLFIGCLWSTFTVSLFLSVQNVAVDLRGNFEMRISFFLFFFLLCGAKKKLQPSRLT